ncbi:MAG TPA: S8 family serine peptidase [Bryobacteraceae bacterium]|nr:S8 family serine peptidase [Bryobacteraceae bacterium]
MKRLFLLLAAGPLFAAGIVPNRYIVELSTEPVAAHVKAAALLHSPEADRHRGAIRAEQASVRVRVEAAGGRVLGAVENVKNALLVEMPDVLAPQLASLPGVRHVFPEREFRMTLDHALPLLHIPEAWGQIGFINAGFGAKIGFIDSGIDISHPGFAGLGFYAPPGFPRGDTAFTNNKVIVARSYVGLLGPDPDSSARDDQGHGTATAMAAAGIPNTGPLSPICGVAPGAFLGAYKVFGTPGYNDVSSDSAILKALDDAVADGMDIVNLSLSSNLAPPTGSDPEVQAVDQAVAAGVIVVASAGNNGPDPETIGSPADSSSVIAVGASNNDRTFSSAVTVPGGQIFQAVPGAGLGSPPAVTAPLVDLATLDGSGQACGTLPARSLAGSIAFIFRGNCTFASKLANAQAAGAVGALVYDNVADESPITMAIGSSTLPSEMISNADGLALKPQIAPGFSITLGFALEPFSMNPSELASFSAAGPSPDFLIKPDLIAVGANIYTAAGTYNSNGLVYDPSGYLLVDGTSFSAPLVAGAAAIVKMARPGLTVNQYRSLLVNTSGTASFTPGVPATVQQAGAGLMNVLAALNATAAVSPVTLGFGAGTGAAYTPQQTLTVTNVGMVRDTFQLNVEPTTPGPALPTLGQSSVTLDPGASASIPVTLLASALASGQYEGVITVQGTKSNVTTHLPYWYGAPTGVPAHITVLYNASSSTPLTAGSRALDAVIFRVTDATGLPVTNQLPVASSVSGGGSVLSLTPYAFGYNAFALSVQVTAGTDIFQIQVGSLTVQVSVLAQ